MNNEDRPVQHLRRYPPPDAAPRVDQNAFAAASAALREIDTLRAQLDTASQAMWAQAQELDTLRAQLAECYRLTGADPDSNEDAMLAPHAVDEVRRLRMDGEKSSELLEKALAQLAEARAALELQAAAHRESQALAVAGARARAIAEVRTLLEQCSGSFVWHVIPQLDALTPAPPGSVRCRGKMQPCCKHE